MAKENNCLEHKVGASIKGTVAKGIGGFLLSEGLRCPFHGLPALAIKYGIISSSIASPLITAHEYLVDKTAILTNYFTNNYEEAHHMAHEIVEKSGQGVTVGILVYSIAKISYHIYKQRNSIRNTSISS